MNKLEPKHLAPYVPYKLKGIAQYENYTGDIELVLGLDISEITTNVDCITYDSFKPILRPMTDIIKPIEGKETTYMYELWEMKTQISSGVFEGYNIENNTAQMIFGTWQHPNSNIEHKHYFEIDLDPEDITFALVTETIDKNKIIDESFSLLGNEFKMYEYLYEHHFDVRGLINLGLSIDINTLE